MKQKRIPTSGKSSRVGLITKLRLLPVQRLSAQYVKAYSRWLKLMIKAYAA